jgi:hypothetical protein
MDTPHDLFRRVMAETGDRITAIRVIRERFDLDLAQAKEVMLQAEGTAASLNEHQERLAEILERAFEEEGERPVETDPGNPNSGDPDGVRSGRG